MPAFHIVAIEPECAPRLWLDSANGKPCRFEDGTTAARFAEELAASGAWPNVKFQPRPIKGETDWRKREAERFAQGSYTLPPWANEPWADRPETADHFAHVGVKDQGKLAYTENADKGEADTQTQIKPGRYLQQFYSDRLDADAIKHWATLYGALYDTCNKLLLATCPDEIERVYTSGPRSCMSHTADAYSSPFHPVRVYGNSPDLALAYLKDEDGRIVARCIVWPDKKIFSTIYGDEYRLRELLAREQYRRGYLEGARIKAVARGSCFVCPYIDGIEYASEDKGKWLVLGEGDIPTQCTHGLTGETTRCDHCDDPCDEEDRYYISDREEYWCRCCYENHAHVCESSGEAFADEDNLVNLADGTVWSHDTFERHGGTCEDCEELFRERDLRDDHGDIVCQPCWERREDQRREEESEDDYSPRVDHPDQSEFALPYPEGTRFAVRLVETGARPHNLLCCLDGINTENVFTTDRAHAERLLRTLQTLNPSERYTLETYPPETQSDAA